MQRPVLEQVPGSRDRQAQLRPRPGDRETATAAQPATPPASRPPPRLRATRAAGSWTPLPPGGNNSTRKAAAGRSFTRLTRSAEPKSAARKSTTGAPEVNPAYKAGKSTSCANAPTARKRQQAKTATDQGSAPGRDEAKTLCLGAYHQGQKKDPSHQRTTPQGSRERQRRHPTRRKKPPDSATP